MPHYRITHRTTYRHSSPVSEAWQVLHLHPRRERYQECLEFDLSISPRPNDLDSRPDFFGNIKNVFTVREPHRELVITSRSLVKRVFATAPMTGLTPPLEKCADLVDTAVLEGEFVLEQFRHASPHVPWLEGAKKLSDDLEVTLPALTWIARLGERFRERFTFDSTATVISTPLAEVLAKRRGVCQDFAHLFLCCVRQKGLPASYVSGYLLTEPPPGQKRLVGADASHAWVSIYIPGFGWTDYDPTNHCFVGPGHVVVAWGRDYGDVSPTRGIFSGGGTHQLFTGVTMELAEPSEVSA